MKNIMVCVTQQKTCDRLIRYGRQSLGDEKGEFFIIHVAPKDDKLLGTAEDGEALDYLYGKALEYGAKLTVVRSNNILDTLVELVKKNEVQVVILGQSGQVNNEESLIESFRKKISRQAELIVVPQDS